MNRFVNEQYTSTDIIEELLSLVKGQDQRETCLHFRVLKSEISIILKQRLIQVFVLQGDTDMLKVYEHSIREQKVETIALLRTTWLEPSLQVESHLTRAVERNYSLTTVKVLLPYASSAEIQNCLHNRTFTLTPEMEALLQARLQELSSQTA